MQVWVGCDSVSLGAQANDHVLALQAYMACLAALLLPALTRNLPNPLQVYLDLDFTLMEMNREPCWGGKQAGGQAVWVAAAGLPRLAAPLHPPGACWT